jgi:dihydrofolate synthase/folylpolyglutamate synthase
VAGSYTEVSMSYQSAIEQLNSMVPELHVAGNVPRRKFSLNEVRVLLEELGEPQKRFPSVLIAGTNGKGSTASTLASILTEAGFRTGLYTSPHLERVNERMRVGGVEIPDEVFGEIFFRVEKAGQELVADGKLPQLPSFFEMITAMAFCWFARCEVEIAVLEVGMGGRLDATNVVEPLVSIITDISLDHMEWLGPTVGAIAREKAGILRPGGVLVRLPQGEEVDVVLDEVQSSLGARLVPAGRYLPAEGTSGSYQVQVLGSVVEIATPLTGAHQQRNVALALATAVELAARPEFAQIRPEAIAQGVKATRWPGRMEAIQAMGRSWLLDVAHNPAGARALAVGLNTVMRDKTRSLLVFSCLRDKPARELAEILFPHFEHIVLAPIHSPRATALEELAQVARSVGTPWEVAQSVEEAIDRAVEADPATIVVSGSVYLVGAVRRLLEEKVL